MVKLIFHPLSSSLLLWSNESEKKKNGNKPSSYCSSRIREPSTTMMRFKINKLLLLGAFVLRLRSHFRTQAKERLFDGVIFLNPRSESQSLILLLRSLSQASIYDALALNRCLGLLTLVSTLEYHLILLGNSSIRFKLCALSIKY